MTMRADARLRSIAEFVPRGSRVADIGTDHAQLAIELIASGRATHVIAADLNVGPLEAARKNISDAGLSKQIETRLGDGLKVLRAGEVDVVCIAGTGGALMCEILSNDISTTIRRLILQPMNVSDRVRNWLEQNDWEIIDEDLAEVGGIIYEIICAVNRRLDQTEVTRQTKRSQSPLLSRLREKRLEKLRRISTSMERSTRAVYSDKYRQLRAEIGELERQLDGNG